MNNPLLGLASPKLWKTSLQGWKLSLPLLTSVAQPLLWILLQLWLFYSLLFRVFFSPAAVKIAPFNSEMALKSTACGAGVSKRHAKETKLGRSECAKIRSRGSGWGKLFNPSQPFCSSLACSFSRSLASISPPGEETSATQSTKGDLYIFSWFKLDFAAVVFNCMLAYCCTVRSFIYCSLLLCTQSEHTCSFCMTNQSLTRQPLMTKLLFPRLAIVTYFFLVRFPIG